LPRFVYVVAADTTVRHEEPTLIVDGTTALFASIYDGLFRVSTSGASQWREFDHRPVDLFSSARRGPSRPGVWQFLQVRLVLAATVGSDFHCLAVVS
jgi:hypothetical protein